MSISKNTKCTKHKRVKLTVHMRFSTIINDSTITKVKAEIYNYIKLIGLFFEMDKIRWIRNWTLLIGGA